MAIRTGDIAVGGCSFWQVESLGRLVGAGIANCAGASTDAQKYIGVGAGAAGALLAGALVGGAIPVPGLTTPSSDGGVIILSRYPIMRRG